MWCFGLLFPALLTVLSQANGDCLQEILESHNHDTSDMCSTERNWALLKHPHDCHKFYVCANYVAEEFLCNENYYFDAIEKRCVRGHCKQVGECTELVRRVPGNCNAFDFCLNGKYERNYCPNNYYFDPVDNICKQIEHKAQHMCSCLLPENSVLPNPENCESFYRCSNNHAWLQQCKPGYYFESKINACILDFTGICTEAPTMTPQESAMLDVCQRMIAQRDSDEGIVFIPDPESCDRFYMCINDRVVAKNCPSGFYYDRETKYCQIDLDNNCEAIREQAEKQKEQEEKEAAETSQKENENNHHEVNEHSAGQPLHLSLSMTHVKVDVEKGNTADKENTAQMKDIESQTLDAKNNIEVPHTKDLPPILHKVSDIKHSINNSNKVPAPSQQVNKPTNTNKVVESENKLPVVENLHAQIKVPGNPMYDKLSSKFMTF